MEKIRVNLCYNQLVTIYDSIIIGGGPAGLSAAIYLARFNRRCLIIDRCEGRWQSREVNENYLGFPEGVAARGLVHRGREQAESFGAEFLEATVTNIEPLSSSEMPECDTSKETFLNSNFKVSVDPTSAYFTRTILFATGVSDIMPDLPDLEYYWGRSLFWCITCDGWKVRKKRIAVLGTNDEAVVSALQFLEYTQHITFLTNKPAGEHSISSTMFERLKKYQISFVEGIIDHIQGEDGWIRALELKGGNNVSVDFLFSELGSRPHSELARRLEVSTNTENYILTDDEQRTNILGIYAAGDVTQRYAHQIVTAAHEGSMAAQAINYDLYSSDQRH